MYELLKIIHIMSGAVLFGTGAGIAFFMVRAHLTKDAATVASVGAIVVLVDFLFTASAVVVQPIRGWASSIFRDMACSSRGWSRPMRSMRWWAFAGFRWCGSRCRWPNWQRLPLLMGYLCPSAITACSGHGSSSDGPPLQG